ncbi:ABC transporter permease [Pseudochelatococcus lubricantis]|uniref:ABC transporter permease n=1 Tax=Pseudochelatococcus lubricantis TaxID=1538102 RepID=UPI0035F05DAF
MNGRLACGLAIVSFVGFCALLSLVWTPHDPLALDIANKLAPPDAAHWLGTDQLGRDLLSLIMRGALASVAVSFVAVTLGVAAGVPLGVLAAGRRGVTGDVVMRISDFLFAFPAIIIAILLRETFGPGVTNAAVAIGLFNVPVFARVAYGAALPVWGSGYVMAARVAGRRGLWIGCAHVLPNIASTLIVQATIQLSLGVLAEASLSYVGLGVQPPQPSWGRMLFEAQTFMAIAPRLAVVPGLAIAVAVLGLSLTGEGLRRALDPRREERR